MAEPLPKQSLAEASLQQAMREWMNAAEQGDLDTCLSYYAKDGAILGSHAPAALGEDEIRRHWLHCMEASAYKLSMEPVDIELAEEEDMACQIGHYDLSIRRWEEGAEQYYHGYFIVLWVQTTDGDWRIRWDLYNTAERHPSHARDILAG